MPRSASSTPRMPPQTIAESATLNTGQTRPSGSNTRDEVDHAAAQEAGVAEHPVDQVAHRAAEHQAERDRPAGRVQPARGADDDHDHHHGDQVNRIVAALGEGERRADVAQVGQVEQPTEHPDVLARRDGGDDDQLGDQVRQQHDGGQCQQEPGARTAPRAATSRRPARRPNRRSARAARTGGAPRLGTGEGSARSVRCGTDDSRASADDPLHAVQASSCTRAPSPAREAQAQLAAGAASLRRRDAAAAGEDLDDSGVEEQPQRRARRRPRAAGVRGTPAVRDASGRTSSVAGSATTVSSRPPASSRASSSGRPRRVGPQARCPRRRGHRPAARLGRERLRAAAVDVRRAQRVDVRVRRDGDPVAVPAQHARAPTARRPSAPRRRRLAHPGDRAPPPGSVGETRRRVAGRAGQPLPGPGVNRPAVVVAHGARHAAAGSLVPDRDESTQASSSGNSWGHSQTLPPGPGGPGPAPRGRRRAASGAGPARSTGAPTGRPSVPPAPTTIRHSLAGPPDEGVAHVRQTRSGAGRRCTGPAGSGVQRRQPASPGRQRDPRPGRARRPGRWCRRSPARRRRRRRPTRPAAGLVRARLERRPRVPPADEVRRGRLPPAAGRRPPGASGLNWKNSSYRPPVGRPSCQVTPSGSLIQPAGAVKW